MTSFSITATCAICSQPFEARTSYGICPMCWSRDKLREWDKIESLRKQIQRANIPDTLTLLEWLSTVSDYKGLCALCLHVPYSRIELMVYENGLTWENAFPCCAACSVHFHLSFNAAVERVQVYLTQDQDEDEEEDEESTGWCETCEDAERGHEQALERQRDRHGEVVPGLMAWYRSHFDPYGNPRQPNWKRPEGGPA